MSERAYERGLVGQGVVAPPKKKRRPADSPDFLAGPATGNASVNRPVRLPVQLAPEDRLAATGETTVGWLTRRYGMVMDSGWDPQQVPLTVIHDLATSGVDDQQLARVLRVTSPLQERLTSRLLGPGGVQGQAGVGVEAAGPASGASPLPRPQQAGLGINAGDLWHAFRDDGIGVADLGRWAGVGLDWPYRHLIGPKLAIAAQYIDPVVQRVVDDNDPVLPNKGPVKALREFFGADKPHQRVTTMPSWDTAWRRAHQSGLGGTLAELHGLTPQDPAYARVAGTSDLIAAWYLDPLNAAGKLNEGRKLAKALPVIGETAEKLEQASTATKAFTRIIPTSEGAPRSRLATAVYQLTAKRPEALFEGSAKAKAAVDDMAKATSAAYIADRYRLPAELAEAISKEQDTGRVKDWLLAGLNGSHPQFRYDELTSKITDNTERYTALKADVLAGKIPEESVKPIMDALAVGTLNLQRTRDTEQVGTYIREMPQETLTGWARQVVKRGVGDVKPVQAPWEESGKLLPDALTADWFHHPGQSFRAEVAHPVLSVLGKVYQGNGRTSDLLRSLFETMPSKGAKIAVADKDKGRVYLEQVGQLLRVPRQELDQLINRYLDHTGPQEAYAVVDDLFKRGKALHPELTNDMLRINKRANASFYHLADTPSGEELHSARKLVDGKPTDFPQPQLDSELITHFPVPDIAAIRDMLSLTGKGQRLVKDAKAFTPTEQEWLLNAAAKFGISPRLLTGAFNATDKVFGAPTRFVGRRWSNTSRLTRTITSAAWVPSVLIRLGFLLRQTGEEHMAFAAAGLPSFLSPVEFLGALRGKGEFGRFADLPEDLMTQGARDFSAKQPTSVKVRYGDQAFHTSWVGELNQLKNSEVARRYLEAVKIHGDGPEAVDDVVTWLNRHPGGQEHWAGHRDIEYSVHSPEGDMAEEEVQRRWIEGISQRIADKTKGNHALLDLLRNGEATVSVDDYARLKYGDQLPSSVQDLLEEYNTWSGAAGTLPRSNLLADLHMELGVPVSRSAQGKPVVKLALGNEEDMIPFLENLPAEARPTWVKGVGYEGKSPDRMGQRFTALAFEYLNDKPIGFLVRNRAYRQYAVKEFNRLRAAGHGEKAAEELARTYALRQMKRVMYDYGERSRFADQMTVMSPFLNAWVQVGRRWAIDIPSRSGFGVGQVAMARKAQLFYRTLEQIGAVRKNERGEMVVHIPGMDQTLYHLTDLFGDPVEFQTDVPLSRFTMLGQPSPGLGPIPMKALTDLPWIRDQWGKKGPLGSALNFLQPYGPEGTTGPAWLSRMWVSTFKQPPPWEIGRSREYSEYLWKGSVMDAQRLLNQKEQKDTGKTRLRRIGDMPEGRAKTAELNKFYRESEEMAADVYMVRGLMGAVLPAQPNLYWPGQKEAEAHKQDLAHAIGAPLGPNGTYTAEQSTTRQKLTSDFLAKHPELELFLFSKSPQVPFADGTVQTGTAFDYKAYMNELRTGVREQFDPKQYATIGAGAVSYWHIQEQYQRAVNTAGATAAERLDNWALVKQANQDRVEAIDRLGNDNLDWRSWHDKTVLSVRQKGGTPPPGWREDMSKDLYVLEAEIKNHLAEIDPDGDIDLAPFATARQKLREELAANPWATQQKGPDGEVARYWRDVAEPYYADLEKLYTQAQTLPKGERAPIYEQIRAYKNNYKALNGMPSPEKVAFQGLDKDAKAKQVGKWSTQPPGWLTDFQREQLGLPVDERISEFWTVMNEAEAKYRNWRIENNISPSSTEWRNARQTLDDWKLSVAKRNGLTAEVQRENLTPFDRAWTAQQLTGSEWQPVRDLVTVSQKALAAAGTDGRPAGIDSEYGMQLMDWFSQQMVGQLQANPSLIPSMEQWGKIMSPDDPLIGIDLWRKFFFGAFR